MAEPVKGVVRVDHTAGHCDDQRRFLRRADFWDEGNRIQPGKVVGWILSTEDQGARFKD